MARAKKKTSAKVNFKGVESRRTPAEGDYLCKVLEAKLGESGKGNEQSEFICEITEGEYKGSKLYLYCPHGEQSLWKLHAFLTALGVDVPEDEMELEYDEYVDQEFMGVVGHESYNGKKQARLVDFDVAEAWEGEKDSGKKSKKDKKSKDDDGDKSSKKKDGKKSKDADDAGDDKKASKKDKKKSKDADDDDDGKKSKKDKKGDKSKKADVEKYDADEVKEMSVKDLAKLIKKHDLDVDLDDFKTDKKKAAAVVSALEDESLIED
jgi:hypothetical protein